MSIIHWEKIGDPEVIAKGFGKSFSKQKFRDHRNQEVDFYFFDQPSWSVVLPITEEGNVLVVRQFKQGAERILEELPGGTADFGGEPPEAVMRRELRQETGYEPAEVVSLGSGWMNSRNSHTPFYCFLAKGCKKVGEARLDEEEQLELFEMPLREWLGRLDKNEMQWDSCLTTIRALPHLGIPPLGR